MNARRRSRRKRSRSGGGAKAAPQAKGQAKNKSKANQADAQSFWGESSDLPSPPTDLRITADATAVVRSLGPAPLGAHETAAEHYLGPIYDRAVMLASALGAAGDLIEPEDLQNRE